MSDLPISNSCFQIKYLWNILLENWKAFHFHKVYSKESFLTVTSFVVSPMVFCETVQKFFTVCRKYCFHINCCKWISKVTNFRRSRSQIFFKIDFSFQGLQQLKRNCTATNQKSKNQNETLGPQAFL